ncbi:unnamed protein product [Amoebophrya sp. A120]|nr:unnamed protein product [Amoebophrya sp. A120]|eukprot:GSA120T00022447001.1
MRLLSNRAAVLQLATASSVLFLPQLPSVVLAELKIKEATRTIKLGTNIATVTVDLKIEADGSTASSTEKNFFPVYWKKSSLLGKVGHVAASFRNDGGSKKDNKNLDVTIVDDAEEGNGSAIIQLTPDELLSQKKFQLTYVLSVGKPYEPLPKELTNLFQEQWLVYEDSLLIPAAQTIESETTILEFPPDLLPGSAVRGVNAAGSVVQIENYLPNNENLVKVDKSPGVKKITFGPFKMGELGDIGEDKIFVHFSHQAHQAYFKNVRREIEVSHWGNVAFKEDYKLKHGGAAMNGAFNRITFTWQDYRSRGMQMPPNPVLTQMEELSVVLPKTARNLHYRDEIGNISSSNARRDEKGYVLAQLRPRYPLLGGWNADWSFSYDVPTRTALKVDPQDPTLHVLNVTLSPPIIRTFSEKLTVEILLPEGSHDIKLQLPKLVSPEHGHIMKSWNATKNSWLDFSGGRLVVGFELDDFFVPEKNILQYKFQVLYRFNTSAMFYEPILLSLLLFLTFLAYIFSGHLLELRILRKHESKFLDQLEFQVSLIHKAMTVFDNLVSEYDTTLKRADVNAQIPLPQKWEPFLEKQNLRHAGFVEDLVKILDQAIESTVSAAGTSTGACGTSSTSGEVVQGAEAAGTTTEMQDKVSKETTTAKTASSQSKSRLEKVKLVLNQYTEHQTKHIDARSSPTTSIPSRQGAKQKAAELETLLGLQLKMLAETPEEEKDTLWTLPVI